MHYGLIGLIGLEFRLLIKDGLCLALQQYIYNKTYPLSFTGIPVLTVYILLETLAMVHLCILCQGRNIKLL